MNKGKNKFPIILIHKGAGNLSLPFVLKQAKFLNPESRVILIGDETNKKYVRYAEHFMISNYMGVGNILEQKYKHFSPNPNDFELFCLQRWFVLLNFIKNNGIKRCFYMDSDVMVYSDLSKESAKFSQYDMTINNKIFGHCMFINNYNTLQEFCDFINKTYQEKNLPEIKKEFIKYLKMVESEKGGISDMAFLNKYYKTHREKIGETGKIINGSTFDNNVNDANGFVVDRNILFNRIKKIEIIDKIPYGIKKDTYEKIRFSVIHFQGPAKKYIPFFYTKKNLLFYIETTIAMAKFFVKKFLNLFKIITKK